MPGACCFYGVCCPPERQAVALANALEIPIESAQKIAGKEKGQGYVLVPRSLPAAEADGDAERAATFEAAATQRLERLHRHLEAELKAILVDLGHETSAG